MTCHLQEDEKIKEKKGKGGGARWVISIREEVRLYEPLPLASTENLIRFFFFFFFFLSTAGATARWPMITRRRIKKKKKKEKEKKEEVLGPVLMGSIVSMEEE
jgi:hypothetical protein